MNTSISNTRWAFNVTSWKPTYEQWKLSVQCIQKEEVERCYKFAFIEDCKTSMVGQMLMRKAAYQSLKFPYDKLRFSRTSSGKPYIVQKLDRDYFFNISHHGDYCVCASEKDFNVGVDIMKIEHRGKKSVDEFFLSMKKQFSPYEWDFLTQPGLESEQLRRFYRLWCLKESYVKATGTGITIDLNKISFCCPTSSLRQSTITTDTQLFLNDKLQTDWHFEEIFLDVNHCVAVAVNSKQQNSMMISKNNTKMFDVLTFEELIADAVPFQTTSENFWENFLNKKTKH